MDARDSHHCRRFRATAQSLSPQALATALQSTVNLAVDLLAPEFVVLSVVLTQGI